MAVIHTKSMESKSSRVLMFAEVKDFANGPASQRAESAIQEAMRSFDSIWSNHVAKSFARGSSDYSVSAYKCFARTVNSIMVESLDQTILFVAEVPDVPGSPMHLLVGASLNKAKHLYDELGGGKRTPGPRVVDNDRDEITLTLNDVEIRGWSYSNDTERRAKMLAAREYAEGWCAGFASAQTAEALS